MFITLNPYIMLTPEYVRQAIKLNNPAITVGNQCKPFTRSFDSVVGAGTDIAIFNALCVSGLGVVTNFFYGNIAWSVWNPNAAGTMGITILCANDIANTAATKSYAGLIIRSSTILNEGFNGNHNDTLCTEIGFSPPHCQVSLSGYLVPVS